ncbi:MULTISPECIES: polysaccharide pyruvyl transferase family protein [Clostridia]|uniref:polysaccharide pyruvyl transferase family protein n=1 Tax=Clostridia TaxID=186801 RepID=UPI000EA01E6E|nr:MULTISPECIES: polysaccharide pyruvyl transferase family protein [Clostridia]NBJ68824.1 polysaccharide pyruvyl transferase family protein [Roseburia sp. 1XD42-34]RKI80202.1 polysaccharide pyruvyl transferase family protein [Clostridium sp. 1xD42-85]
MRNYLIRAGMSPLDTFDAPYVMLNNAIGGNVGNLIYQYSIFRTLMTEETTVTPNYYKVLPEDADEINDKYDGLIIPFADAFREGFASALRKYTKLIKKLRIPVVVIGVGLRAPFEPKLDEGFPFDEDVKEFVRAVLEKSNMIGVRGEITARYLSRLGFREGIDHMVIGCPSMYTFGRQLNIRDTSITKESMVCVNSSRLSPKHVLKFIAKGMEEYQNHYFIPQWMKELRLTYMGTPPIAKESKYYPVKMSDPVYMANRVRFFLNVPTWLDFMRQADLAFGARLHGNISATIAGTPSLIIPKDARMRELVEYHNLTHVRADDINEDMKLSDVVENSDFQAPTKVQGRNFDHFIDFLNKNELSHIYKETITPTKVPLDDKLHEINHPSPVYPISGCDLEELVNRLESYYPKLEKKHNESLKDLKSQLNKNKKTVKKLEGTLNRKSARLALKVANMFRF